MIASDKEAVVCKYFTNLLTVVESGYEFQSRSRMSRHDHEPPCKVDSSGLCIIDIYSGSLTNVW